MVPRRTSLTVAVVVAMLALSTAACTDGSPSPAGTTSPEASPTASEESPAVVTTSIPEPDSMVPQEVSGPGGLAVVRALFTGLVTYDPETHEAVPAVAEAIESDDGGTTWTITLEEGWAFHDGRAVTSESFVDAWNHGAHGPNQVASNPFFADIEGYGALQCGASDTPSTEGAAGGTDSGGVATDCEGRPPQARTLSGLEVVFESEFRVTLDRARPSWPQLLGYPAFFPLPPGFFDDPDAFGRRPVGNGPFRLADRSPRMVRTRANDTYAGDPEPQVDGIDFRVESDRDAALDALHAGEVDVLVDVPPARWPETRSQVHDTAITASGALNYVGFPTYDGAFSEVDLRAALSMAVDRELITESLFERLRVPANDVLPPVVPGHQDTVCPAWEFDPGEARERFEQAGGLDGPLTIWLNEGSGHRPWLEAVVRQWSEHLGIDASQVTFEQRPFDEHLEIGADQGFTGPFRLGWEVRHPHPSDVLQALLDSRSAGPAGANTTGYASDAFDEALDEALATTDLDESLPLYQEAARIACEDVPLAPMFYGVHTVAWTGAVSDVAVDVFGTLDTTAITLR